MEKSETQNLEEIRKIIENQVTTIETNVVIKNQFYNGHFAKGSVFTSDYSFSVKQASDKK